MAKKITKRSADYSQWYHDIVQMAELADHSPVRGCMVIRPNGYAIWELMQAQLDQKLKETGHRNLYFPLFIPQSFLQKEAEHVEGFAPELAVVTHGGGKELEEPLVVRPTSETMAWHMYKNWISSYRDLPLLYNQWANVVRWEMRTRLFLRTTEFLWQEGHTAHETEEEAQEETQRMLEVYRDFAENVLAIPVVPGIKTENEKFAGAVATHSIEALMQDGKALQLATSHYLGQNFAKAFDVQFQDRQGNLSYVYATSWGCTTRMLGGLIMCHSDDQGLILPPKVAANKVVIVPIWRSEEDRTAICAAADTLLTQLAPEHGALFDDRDELTPGFKFNDWELKGIPVRIELGPRDLKEKQAVVVRRDTRKKESVPLSQLGNRITEVLETMQRDLLVRAQTFQAAHTRQIDAFQELSQNGFLLAHWCGRGECEKQIASETKATIRNIPYAEGESGLCIKCGQPSPKRVYFARAY